MPSAEFPVHTMTNLLIQWLKDQLPTYSGRVGDTVAPADTSGPYYVVHHITGGDLWGPGWVSWDSLDLMYQVDSVAARRDAAQLAAVKVRSLMLRLSELTGKPLVPAPPGWVVAKVEPDSGIGGPDREGVPPAAVFAVPERYVLSLTPA